MTLLLKFFILIRNKFKQHHKTILVFKKHTPIFYGLCGAKIKIKKINISVKDSVFLALSEQYLMQGYSIVGFEYYILINGKYQFTGTSSLDN